MNQLPNEVLGQEILKRLPLKEQMFVVPLVCKKWSNAVMKVITKEDYLNMQSLTVKLGFLTYFSRQFVNFRDDSSIQIIVTNQNNNLLYHLLIKLDSDDLFEELPPRLIGPLTIELDKKVVPILNRSTKSKKENVIDVLYLILRVIDSNHTLNFSVSKGKISKAQDCKNFFSHMMNVLNNYSDVNDILEQFKMMLSIFDDALVDDEYMNLIKQILLLRPKFLNDPKNEPYNQRFISEYNEFVLGFKA